MSTLAVKTFFFTIGREGDMRGGQIPKKIEHSKTKRQTNFAIRWQKINLAVS